MSQSYDPQSAEEKWYAYWLEHDLFKSTPDERESYTIVIPPPNVTGVLHMGHMLNNTIQDVLIRRARLKGYNACWVPGTDHASIATEAKVVAQLKEQGLEKADLSREEFMGKAWEWTHDYGGRILGQLKKLGASCDWSRTKFTLDDDLTRSVQQVFIDLYNKGHVYRGHRMVNWDPEALTTLSDEEVEHKEENGHLYHIKYEVKGAEPLTIATTRPETILGDTALCVNPDDGRYAEYIGKKAFVPIIEREIPIIADDYVDMDFGTGCLKITPAHDINDYGIGQRHGLETIDIFNDDATLNNHGGQYEGQDRFKARKTLTADLKEQGLLLKQEEYRHTVGTSERTGAVIEPRLSDQWFLKMKELAQPAIDAVKNDEVELVPSKFKSTYFHWMENIRDWNISRQLIWGHRIPAYFYGDGKDDFVVAASEEKALSLARKKTGNNHLVKADLHQDNDVLDTWFSSWLWPISVFNGILEPDNEEINYYYPTRDLVTGPDILFFWVARMIMAGYEYRDLKPFNKVYLTGLVRDEKRRKMSKSLGNSPDAVGLMEKYSADGVRVGLLLSSAAGNDLLFDESLCQQGRNFSNKIWNAYKLIDGWDVADELEQPSYLKQAIQWYDSKLSRTLNTIEDHYNKYRISDVLMTAYRLIWDDFCSWLLEIAKPDYQQPIDATSRRQILELLEKNLIMIHPFMPFITEEIWQMIADRGEGESICITRWPEQTQVDEGLLEDFENLKDLTTGIRKIRKDKQIPFKDELGLQTIGDGGFAKRYRKTVDRLVNIGQVEEVGERPSGAAQFRVGAAEYFVPVADKIDLEAEKEKINSELDRARGLLKSVHGKLNNQRFVDNAPEEVVARERKKESDAKEKIQALETALEELPQP